MSHWPVVFLSLSHRHSYWWKQLVNLYSPGLCVLKPSLQAHTCHLWLLNDCSLESCREVQEQSFVLQACGSQSCCLSWALRSAAERCHSPCQRRVIVFLMKPAPSLQPCALRKVIWEICCDKRSCAGPSWLSTVYCSAVEPQDGSVIKTGGPGGGVSLSTDNEH